jgi:hypothetical protein
VADRIIRQSAVKTWKRCPRKFTWQYIRSLMVTGPQDAQAKDLGTIVHYGVQVWYEGGDPLAAIEEMRAADEEAGIFGYDPKGWADTYALATIMVEGWMEWLAEEGEDAGYETLWVEKPVEHTFDILGDRITVTGKPDRLVRHEATGLILLEDTKTVQSLEQAGRQLQVDDQLLTYAVMLRLSEGVRIDGARHSMLRKVKRTARSTPPFYGRVEVSFNDTQMRNHYRHMVGTLTSIVSAWQAMEQDPEAFHLVAPPNPTRDCSWDCPFLAVCPMADDGSDVEGALNALFVVGDTIPYHKETA